MTLHYKLTGNPFTVNPDTITIICPSMGLEGTEVSRDWGSIACLESLDEMQALLKAEGLKFAKIQYLEYDWAWCLINTSQIKFLEARGEQTKVQVGYDYDGEITVDMPLEQVLDLLAAARR